MVGFEYDKPNFVHDCDCCEFLGTFNKHDLYFCSSEHTVVARYGSDGADYTSGLEFATKDGNKHLYMAKVIKIGLILDEYDLKGDKK